jgi:hypothetical protein
MVRISANEVRLTGDTPTPRRPGATTVQKLAAAKAAYPVRVTFAPRGAATGVTARAPRPYPIKVEFKADR